LIGSKASEQMNAFLSDSKYIEDSNISNSITVTKCETILHCTMDQALLSYFSNDMLLNSEPNCARFRTSNYIEYEDLVKIYKEKDNAEQISKYKRDLCISSLDFALPFPFNPRTSNRSDSMHYDPATKTFLMVGKNFLQEGEDDFCVPLHVEMCKKRNTEPRSTKAYRFFLFSGRMYQQIDEKNILVKDIAMLDFGGWASSKPVTTYLIQDRKNKYKKNIVKMAKLIPEEKKISDCTEQLTRKIDGKVVDGYGNLLSNQFSMEKEFEEIQVIESKVVTVENVAPQDNFECKEEVIEIFTPQETTEHKIIVSKTCEVIVETNLPQESLVEEVGEINSQIPIEKKVENVQMGEDDVSLQTNIEISSQTQEYSLETTPQDTLVDKKISDPQEAPLESMKEE
jgi:hypothetical protein